MLSLLIVAVVLSFSYSTVNSSSVPSCPAVVTATSSGSAVVGFVYTITTNATVGVSVCGAGNLQCTSYGNNEYSCPTLLNGAQYVYNTLTGATASYSLTNEVECNSFGDGFLPLNYEGISFGGNFPSSRQCTSIYQRPGSAVSILYNVVLGSNNFTYGSPIANAAQACAATIPNLYTSSSTGTNFVFPASSSTGGDQPAVPTGAASSTASINVIALLFIAAVTQTLLL